MPKPNKDYNIEMIINYPNNKSEIYKFMPKKYGLVWLTPRDIRRKNPFEIYNLKIDYDEENNFPKTFIPYLLKTNYNCWEEIFFLDPIIPDSLKINYNCWEEKFFPDPIIPYSSKTKSLTKELDLINDLNIFCKMVDLPEIHILDLHIPKLPCEPTCILEK